MGKAFELISEGNKRIKEVVYAMAITTGAFELKIHDICLFTVPLYKYQGSISAGFANRLSAINKRKGFCW